MKFLFTSAYSGLGGGESIQLSLAEELCRQGHETQLLVRAPGEFSRQWQELDQKTHILPFRPAPVYFLPALSARSAIVKKIAAVLRAERIDIAHADYHSLPYLAAAARAAGCPIIWTCMGWWFRPKPWQRAFFKGLDLHFALSSACVTGFLDERDFMPRNSMHVLHPGVDTRRFRPALAADEARAAIRQRYGMPPDAPLILHVGRFQDVKGHDTFQEIARRVAGEEPRARFLVAGDNPQRAADIAYQRRIRARAEMDPILKERLVYAGHVQQIEALYPAADIAVCPSRFESYGMANLEAMACEIPVVSTNRGGPVETVVDGETGYLVPPRDAEAYAQRVLQLLGDAALRAAMGAAGRRRVEAHFSIAMSTGRFLARCESLLAS